jgi:hypothetical protein
MNARWRSTVVATLGTGALLGLGALTVPAAHAATPVTLYAAPTGSGTTCSLSAPCSLTGARDKWPASGRDAARRLDIGALIASSAGTDRAWPGRPSRAALSLVPAGLCVLVDFYRDRTARTALLLTSAVLCYVGGAGMFWFHAVYLAEGGPAIPWQAHWLLDSSFGFLALTPALGLILPFATWVAQVAAPRPVPWLYAMVTGGLFAVVTIPGPLAHDTVVGRGTWIADHVTRLIGDPGTALGPVTHYPVLAELAQQLGVGLPWYAGLTMLTLPLLRWTLGREAIGEEGEAGGTAAGPAQLGRGTGLIEPTAVAEAAPLPALGTDLSGPVSG